jgi:hypothetical protein
MPRGRCWPSRNGAHARNGVAVTFAPGDAHRLSFPDGAFDAVVCLRVLMHTPDWRASLGELCRVAGDRVVFDYPSLYSAAALQAAVRRVTQRFDPSVEAYRVFSPASVANVLDAAGFRIAGGAPAVRAADCAAQGRQFRGVDHARRRRARARGPDAASRIARDRRGAPGPAVKVLVTGATGFTGGHLARTLAARGYAVTAMVRDPQRASDLPARRHHARARGSRRAPRRSRPRSRADSTSSTTLPPCTGRPVWRTACIGRSTPWRSDN